MLLGLVLSVWGVLGFRIMRTVNPSANITPDIVRLEKFVPMAIKKRDTFSIVANYRDPFLGTMPKADKPKKASIGIQKKKVLSEKNIVYTGFITKSGSGGKIFFLTVDGQQRMLSKNESFKEVKLVSGNSKKIRVKYNGKTKSIPLTQ